MLRFDRKFCPSQLLKDMTRNRNILLEVGDLSADNHWLESTTYVRNVGERWDKTAMFAQFRRGIPAPNEKVSKNGLRDQLYVFLHVVNPNYLQFWDISVEQVKQCLQKVHLSVMPDDGEAPYSNDYTRCETYKRYKLPVDWSENDFNGKPTTPPTTEFEPVSNLIDPSLAHCSSNGRIFGGEGTDMSNWPFLVRLEMSRYKFAGSVTDTHVTTCYGTIVGNHWVLTAAHVCDYFRSTRNYPKMKASFGKGIKKSMDLVFGTNMFIHPDQGCKFSSVHISS